jgi:hypothetical protein
MTHAFSLPTSRYKDVATATKLKVGNSYDTLVVGGGPVDGGYLAGAARAACGHLSVPVSRFHIGESSLTMPVLNVWAVTMLALPVSSSLGRHSR